MRVLMESSQRTGVPLSHVQFAANDSMLAVPAESNLVSLLSTRMYSDGLLKRLAVLSGHECRVTAIAMAECKNSGTMRLCTASSDCILVWEVEAVLSALNRGDPPPALMLAEKELGYVRHVCLSSNIDVDRDQLVCICIENDAYVFSATEGHLVSRLEGHNAAVTASDFCMLADANDSGHNYAMVITISEDRTFKIWNIDSCTLYFQSAIISSSPFLCLAIDREVNSTRFATGTGDGIVRVFDIRDGNCRRTINVTSLLQTTRQSLIENFDNLTVNGKCKVKTPAVISSLPKYKRIVGNNNEKRDGKECDKDGALAVISICFIGNQRLSGHCSNEDSYKRNITNNLETNVIVSDVLSKSPTLLIGTVNAVVHMNMDTGEANDIIDLGEPIHMIGDSAEVLSIPAVGSLAFSPLDDAGSMARCYIGGAFGCTLHVLRFFFDDNEVTCTEGRITSDDGSDCDQERSSISGMVGESLSMLASTPLPSSSPLRASLILKKNVSLLSVASTKQRRASKTTAPKPINSCSNAPTRDLPVVFHTKVRSSGYGTPPKAVKLFSGTAAAASHRAKVLPAKAGISENKEKSGIDLSTLTKKRVSLNKGASNNMTSTRRYPLNCNPPVHLQEKHAAALTPPGVVHNNAAIFRLEISNDGTYIATASADHTCRLLRHPLSEHQGRGISLNSNDAAVNTVAWGCEDNMLCTSTADGVVSLWPTRNSEPILSIKTACTSMMKDGEKRGDIDGIRNIPFGANKVSNARFYYQDKFLLVGATATTTSPSVRSSGLFMYKYYIDDNHDDIKTTLNNSRYKLVKHVALQGDAQGITCFAAPNSYFSYLSIAACSNRSVQVIDLSVGRVVRCTNDAHVRPVHSIAIIDGSRFVTFAAEAYNLFCTSAAGDCLKLWDIRVGRCVRRFDGHANRAYPAGLSFSPCIRFLATGGENRSAYLFDLRSSHPLHRLGGHSDVVSDVSFHPVHPQLVTATLDGQMKFFADI